MASPIRYLHLSDFHVGKDDYSQRKIFDVILHHVKERQVDGWVPDLLFITGDIANRGQIGEYNTFNHEFLAKLQAILGDSWLGRVFAVPGNHDVDQYHLKFLAREDMWAQDAKVFDATTESQMTRQNFLLRGIQSFMEKDESHAPKSWLDTPNGTFTQVVDIRGVSLGIIGINTAWLSKDNRDKGNLTPGFNLIQDALERLPDCAVRIVLGHHPLDWFLEKDANRIRQIFGKYGILYLHGHLHCARARGEANSAGRPFLSIQAGAAFQARDDELWRNGLLWGELDLEQQKLRLQPRHWSADHDGWVMSSDAFSPEREAQDGKWWEFALPITSQSSQQNSTRTSQSEVTQITFSEGFNHRNKITSNNEEREIDIQLLTEIVRTKLEPSIRESHGWLRVLEMSQQIGLGEIYVNVNILERITSHRRLKISELLQKINPDSDEFYRRGLGKTVEDKVSALEVVECFPKLMILGKPGSGKTTFMKHLIIKCISGNFQPYMVPIFVNLKDYSEASSQPDILGYIISFMANYGFSSVQVHHLLRSGRMIFLFDGLDEVREVNIDRVIKQIQKFSDCHFFSEEFQKDFDFHQSQFNKFSAEVTAAREQVDEFFRSVVKPSEKELEGLKKNISEYKKKLSVVKTSENELVGLNKILSEYNKKLKLHKNLTKKLDNKKAVLIIAQKKLDEWPDLSGYHHQGVSLLRETFPARFYSNHFVITCRIAASEYTFTNFKEVEIADFDDTQIKDFAEKWFWSYSSIEGSNFLLKLSANPRVRELASNPLLLTLLCLIFQEYADFPVNRADLYQEGISLLLKKWDAKRNINRDNAYENLYLSRKEDLLSRIAMSTFVKGDYFFMQRTAEQYILEYIQNLPDASSDLGSLQLDSEAILKSIEAQHGLLVERARGVYSFSHLSFQEYFAARKVVTISDPNEFEGSLNDLASHVSEQRWREVILLALGMLSDAGSLLLLMKARIDFLVSNEQEIQSCLKHVHEVTLSLHSEYAPPAVRAFLLSRMYTMLEIPKLSLSFVSLVGKLINLACDIVYDLTSCSNSSFDVHIAKVNGLNNSLCKSFSPVLKSILGLDFKSELACLLDGNLSSLLESSFLKDEYQLDENDKEVQSLIRISSSCFRRNDMNCFALLAAALARILRRTLTQIKYISFIFAPEIIFALHQLEKDLPDLKDSLKATNWLKENGEEWIKAFRNIFTKFNDMQGEGIIDWQIKVQNLELLSTYYNTNLFLVNCLKGDFYINNGVRREIAEGLFLPYVYLNRGVSFS